VGSVTFHLNNRLVLAGPYVCELRLSTNGLDWITLNTVTNASTNWTAYTVEVNVYEPVMLQFIRPENGANG